jgi:hypothetical protein
MRRRTRHPLTIAGSVVGVLAVVLIVFTFNGTDIGFIAGYERTFLALAVLIFILFGLNIGRNAVLK